MLSLSNGPGVVTLGAADRARAVAAIKLRLTAAPAAGAASSVTQPPGSSVKALVATPFTATPTLPTTGRVIRLASTP